MNPENITSNIETKSFWEEHFEQFKLSKLSKAAYARKHNLALHRFTYWTLKFEKLSIKKVLDIKADFIPITIPPISILGNIPPILCTLQLGDNKKLFLHNEAALKVCLESYK